MPVGDRRGTRGRSEETISLAALKDLIVRRLWVIAAAVIGTLGAAALALALLSPVYRASTTLIVVRPEGLPLDSSAVQLSRSLARTYVEIARSKTAISTALEQLALAESPQQLQKRVRAVTVGDTELIVISVEDQDPARAAQIANTLAEVVRAQVHSFMNVDNVRVVDAAGPPQAPAFPRPKVVLGLAGILSLPIGIGIAWLLDFLKHAWKRV